MYFLMCVILALTAARFLTNALRVWVSMVPRIGKERANLTIYVLLRSRVPSTYAGNYAARKPSTSLLTLPLVAVLLLCCVAMYLFEDILLAILNTFDANPQSDTLRIV